MSGVNSELLASVAESATGVESSNLVAAAYLVSAVLFIVGMKRLTKVRTARAGNAYAAVAMFVAIAATLIDIGTVDYSWMIAGVVIGGAIGGIAAVRVPMTKMPEMVAIFNGFGGGSSALVALSVLWSSVIEPGASGSGADILGGAAATTLVLSVMIGALTMTGSVVAYLKLAEVISGNAILLAGRHVLNAVLLLGALGVGGYITVVAGTPMEIQNGVLAVTIASLLLGVFLVIPIGGADMPVVISLLNSYSGVAASATGFVLGNNLLIISGALVGAAGLILTQIMCVAMNRSLANVIFGGFGAEESGGGGGGGEYVNVTSAGAEEAAMMLEDAESVIFVPGYGLAVAQAQHAVRELASVLEGRGATVRYAIHPVAGRMPGHMNVLLAEADVPYEQLIEMDIINPEFKDTDVAIVIGANDVVNPAAEHDKTSPIYGMPILTVHEARMVFVIKRSLGAGFAGIKNELFEANNTNMVFGDAKKVITALTQELKAAD
ncbi:MAG: NAD(P)(+) transhydrogenase (Re/Si-specific) subunit beta [Polyangiaceae bacterium]|nr:NAD(P)(+) transhydrogenase (Re/Si-specific) subunit beta [Polyangiaceae bacterium]